MYSSQMDRILGLNVGSNAAMPNGRGWVDPATGRFAYLPIPETEPLVCPAPTYADLGFADLPHPDLPVHLDPEFDTFTYGHRRRFGDARLWDLRPGDLLFFYATLDHLPERRAWGLYAIGYFVVEEALDVRGWPPDQVMALSAFRANAHLKRVEPGVDLLVRGGPGSRLLQTALPLSDPDDPRRPHPALDGLLTTVTGRPLGGQGWWRWLLCSQSERFAERLQRQP